MSSYLEQFQLSREQVDVDEAARKVVWYFALHAEATQMLSRDPAERDRLLAEQNAHATKDAMDPEAFLIDDNPDIYLAAADARLRELAPLRSMEDAIQCCAIAFTACMLYTQYKINYAFGHYEDLSSQYNRKQAQLWDEFYVDFARRHSLPGLRSDTAVAPLPPVSAASSQYRSRHTTPNGGQAPRRAHGRTAAAASGTVSPSERKALLANVKSLVGKRFLYSPPPSMAEEEQIIAPGFWQVQSAALSQTDDVVEWEFRVLAEHEDDWPIPMTEKDVEGLLMNSFACSADHA